MFGKSKYYDAIVANLRRILGAPEATEAELDTQLSAMDDFSAVEQAAQANVDAAVTAERDQLKSQVETLKADLTLANTRLADANTRATDAESKVAKLTTDLANAENERNTLAGKVAQLQAGNDPTPRVADGGIATPVANVSDKLEGFVVKTPDLAKRVLGKRAAS